MMVCITIVAFFVLRRVSELVLNNQTGINKQDNGIIVGLTMFYACLSVLSLILGDILMAIVDPRISFTTSGGKR